MCVLGLVEETDSLLQQVRLFNLIKADRYVGWEKLIALESRRLYFMGIQCALEASGVFSNKVKHDSFCQV